MIWGLTIPQILGIIGVPSLFSVISWAFKKNKEAQKKRDERTKALELGMQALLRAQMINDYNHWTDKGYAPIYARENFENVWIQYHGLGANGVMNDIHDKFMALPTEKPTTTTNKK